MNNRSSIYFIQTGFESQIIWLRSILVSWIYDKVDVRINCELCNNFKMHYHMHLADALAKDFFMHSLGIKPVIHCLHYMKHMLYWLS